MPFNLDTPQQILERLQAEFDLAMPGSDARLRHSPESVISKAVTLAALELHGHIAYLLRQILPDTAEAEFLEFRHGALWGILRRAAAAASGQVQFTGTNGVTIPSGTVLVRADNAEFELVADATISGGVALASVLAALPGVNGNTAAASSLTLSSPIAGVNNAAVVQAGGLTGGVELEADNSLRQRIVERIQNPPHGGNAADYVAWAKEVPGVTRVWVYPNQMGAGTVLLIFVMDDKPGTIIPSAGEVADVQDHIDAVRPVTADLLVTAPTPVTINMTINLSPNTLAIREAVTAEIADLFQRESAPGGVLYKSRINEAISVAAGEFDHALVTPSANIIRAFGEVSVLGTITFGSL